MQHTRHLQRADHDARDNREHEQWRREEPPRVAAAVAANELCPPHSGREELAGQLRPVLARPVGDFERWIEPDGVSGPADAEVEFPVLPAADRLIEESGLLESVATEHPEVGGFRRPLLRAAVVARPAEAERAVVGAGDGRLERVLPPCEHHPADVGCARALQGRDRGLRVAGFQLGVGVDPRDKGVGARADREIQTHRDVSIRILDGVDAAIAGSQFRHQLGRAVVGRSEGDHEFLVARIVLAENRPDRVLDVAELVENGHNVGDPGIRDLLVCHVINYGIT